MNAPTSERPEPRGMRVAVYRGPYGDCTNGGPSATADHVIVVHPDLPAISAPREGEPVMLLQPGQGRRRWVLVPENTQPDEVGPSGMFGGNYAGTSDGRWTDVVGSPGMVPIHDRQETWDQYNANFS